MSLSLRSLSDQKLLSRTKTLTVQERTFTLNLLLHLNEVERRKLYLKLGFNSMFTYCTEGLGYSASAAKRRICTARCVARFPEVLRLLKSNEVNLSTVTQVSKILSPDRACVILGRIRGKSQREVEAIVAEYEPLAALPRERVRTVVVRVPAETKTEALATNPNPPTESRSAVAGIASEEDQDRNGPDPRAAMAPQPAMQFERRAVIQFSAREAVMTKLELVRSLASHRLPANAPLEQLIEFLADDFIRRQDPKARHERRETRNPDATAKASLKTSSARAIPARVRDEVFVRNKGECCYVGTNGKRCGSRHVLQIDHIKPVARGGAGALQNLRLLCAHHNRLEAERLMGRAGPPA